MSRWRPPSNETRSPYITAAGYARLKAEYETLWSQRRPAVVQALAAAAAEGDRSENAEYQYRKKELREIDRRVHYLQQRIPALKVAGGVPADTRRVYFGANVTLRDDEGAIRAFRIVGADEAQSAQTEVSVDAPLARALLGRRIGERLRIVLPGGAREYQLTALSYEC